MILAGPAYQALCFVGLGSGLASDDFFALLFGTGAQEQTPLTTSKQSPQRGDAMWPGRLHAPRRRHVLCACIRGGQPARELCRRRWQLPEKIWPPGRDYSGHVGDRGSFTPARSQSPLSALPGWGGGVNTCHYALSTALCRSKYPCSKIEMTDSAARLCKFSISCPEFAFRSQFFIFHVVGDQRAASPQGSRARFRELRPLITRRCLCAWQSHVHLSGIDLYNFGWGLPAFLSSVPMMSSPPPP